MIRREYHGYSHCNHCKESVERALEELEGVTAKVYLKKGEALVQAVGSLEENMIKEAVKKAGFNRAKC